MSFKNFYDGDLSAESKTEGMENARHTLRSAYDTADVHQKAHIEKTFNQKIQDFWPLLPNHEAEVLAIVTEIVREATASGI